MTTFKEAQIIIGIDPDLEKSGVAVLGQSHFELKNLNFAEVVELFKAEQDLIKKVVIRTLKAIEQALKGGA
ncbi:hypothetical protein ACT4Y9_10780 [Acinetobacter baumannii]|uniref:hypothetical protein n=1 Tax=Acinetobacter baumannii TaxID=470 RepID=UPI0023410085|nr:hypothetical protein [Acinetobacter baumannii]